MNKVKGLLLATAVAMCVGNAQAIPGASLVKSVVSSFAKASNVVKAKLPKVDSFIVKVAPFLVVASVVKLDLARKLNNLWFATLGNASYYTPVLGKLLYGLESIPHTLIDAAANPKFFVPATVLFLAYLAATRSDKVKQTCKKAKADLKGFCVSSKNVAKKLFSKDGLKEYWGRSKGAVKGFFSTLFKKKKEVTPNTTIAPNTPITASDEEKPEEDKTAAV